MNIEEMEIIKKQNIFNTKGESIISSLHVLVCI